MFESVVCNSSARLESETLTTVASIWDRNEPRMATDEIFQRCGSGRAASSCSSDAIHLLRGVAAVETAEVVRGEQADRQKTKPQSRRVNGRAQVEVSDTADQDIGDSEVEKAPQDVDGRRGEAFAARLGEGALKRPPHRTGGEVGDCVAKKHPAEKMRNERQPVHRARSFGLIRSRQAG